MMGNPQKPDDPKKAYAKAQISQELTLKGLSKLVSSQTTVSRADVSAVLISTVENLFDALRDGKQVDFGELGKFRLQVTSRGADTAEEFTANNITGKRPILTYPIGKAPLGSFPLKVFKNRT